MKEPEKIFTHEALQQLFPPERSNEFFDALFGDASEGAYDIALQFDCYDAGQQNLNFFLNLHERPGRCLACNLTYGLPEVFSRHPIINIKGLVAAIDELLAGSFACEGWKLGHTVQHGKSLHSIPLQIDVRRLS